jgi:hypothetical protein
VKRIPLSAANSYQGRTEPRDFAVVDDEDYERLIAMGPWALRTTRSHRYAVRTQRYDDGSTHQVAMHRVVMGLEFGDPLNVDHIDHNGLNNQRSNLRLATHAENHQNKCARSGGTSRFRNVHWYSLRGRWRVIVREGDKNRQLGCFDDELDAAIAAQAWRDEHMPFAQPDPALVAALELRSASAA